MHLTFFFVLSLKTARNSLLVLAWSLDILRPFKETEMFAFLSGVKDTPLSFENRFSLCSSVVLSCRVHQRETK